MAITLEIKPAGEKLHRYSPVPVNFPTLSMKGKTTFEIGNFWVVIHLLECLHTTPLARCGASGIRTVFHSLTLSLVDKVIVLRFFSDDFLCAGTLRFLDLGSRLLRIGSSLNGAFRFLVGILTRTGLAKGTVDPVEASNIDVVNVDLLSLA